MPCKLTQAKPSDYPLNQFDVFNKLQTSYKYSFSSDRALTEVRQLLKIGMAKHEFGIAKPTLVDMKKTSPYVIPKRET